MPRRRQSASSSPSISPAKIWALDRELAVIDGLEWHASEAAAEAGEEELAALEAFAGFTLPGELRELYGAMRGFSFEWVAKPARSPVVLAGKAQIMSPERLVNGPREHDPTWVAELEAKYCIFDCIDTVSGSHVLLHFADGEARLVWFLHPRRMLPLRLSLREYIEAVVDVRGLLGWQALFVDEAALTDAQLDEHRSAVARRVEQLGEINPNSATLQRLRELPPSTRPPRYYAIAQAQDYRRRFHARIDEFAAAQDQACGIVGANFERWPLTEQTIARIEAELDRPLPDSLLGFYAQLNGLNMHWSAGGSFPGRYRPGAAWTLSPLAQVFAGGDDRIGDPARMDAATRELARHAWPIYSDMHGTTVIHLDPSADEPSLYLFDGGRLLPLTLSFPEFVERLLETLGVDYWQRFFVAPAALPDAELDRYPAIPALLALLFPGLDVSGYRQVALG